MDKEMKRSKNAIPKKSELRGDALGVSMDPSVLEALAISTRNRYEAEGSEDSRLRYTSIVKNLMLSDFESRNSGLTEFHFAIIIVGNFITITFLTQIKEPSTLISISILTCMIASVCSWIALDAQIRLTRNKRKQLEEVEEMPDALRYYEFCVEFNRKLYFRKNRALKAYCAFMVFSIICAFIASMQL